MLYLRERGPIQCASQLLWEGLIPYSNNFSYPLIVFSLLLLKSKSLKFCNFLYILYNYVIFLSLTHLLIRLYLLCCCPLFSFPELWVQRVEPVLLLSFWHTIITGLHIHLFPFIPISCFPLCWVNLMCISLFVLLYNVYYCSLCIYF